MHILISYFGGLLNGESDVDHELLLCNIDDPRDGTELFCEYLLKFFIPDTGVASLLHKARSDVSTNSYVSEFYILVIMVLEFILHSVNTVQTSFTHLSFRFEFQIASNLVVSISLRADEVDFDVASFGDDGFRALALLGHLLDERGDTLG